LIRRGPIERTINLLDCKTKFMSYLVEVQLTSADGLVSQTITAWTVKDLTKDTGVRSIPRTDCSSADNSNRDASIAQDVEPGAFGEGTFHQMRVRPGIKERECTLSSYAQSLHDIEGLFSRRTDYLR
jgi:hypothetical protein